MNIVRISVPNPEELLDPNSYGPGAVVRIESSPDGVAFALSGTVPIVAGQTSYVFYDQTAATPSAVYRCQYASATGAKTSDYTPPQTVSIDVLSVVDFRAHVRTNATDEAIQTALAANAYAIDAVLGNLGTQANTLYLDRTRFIWLPRPASSIVKITELYPDIIGLSAVVLDPTDWMLSFNRTFVERLMYGTHPGDTWSTRVLLEWVPVDDSANRRRAMVQLVALDLAHRPGVGSYSVGDVTVNQGGESYAQARSDILNSLLLARGGTLFA